MITLWLTLTNPAAAVDLLVPLQYPTVADALAVAVPGDEVVLAPGTYCEAITIGVDGLVLRGGRPAQPPTLDGSCLATAAVVEVGAGLGVTLESLMIDGADNRVPLLVSAGASVVATDVAFLHGYTATSSALVDLLAAGTSFDCQRCFFCGGYATLDGGALRSDDFFTITESVFAFNDAGDDSGAIDVRGGALLHNNTFIANTAGGYGGAIRVYGGNADLVNNIFVDHVAGFDYAIDEEGGTATGTTNLFHLNELATEFALTNNLGATDPLLAGRTGTCLTVNPELTAGSPAIGTGDASGVHTDIGARRYDVDGDGVGAGDGDCDDSNPSIFPGAVELCNRADDDCDGLVDDDDPDAQGLDWYIDFDADGFGDENWGVTTACEAPDTFYVNNADDCNDDDDAIHPGAAEVCSGEDEDCDDLVDEDDPDIVLSVWYADDDADGHGDPDVFEASCDAPLTYVSNADDCQPTLGDAFPGAPELCNGIDDDCDEGIDEGCDTGTTPVTGTGGTGTGGPGTTGTDTGGPTTDTGGPTTDTGGPTSTTDTAGQTSVVPSAYNAGKAAAGCGCNQPGSAAGWLVVALAGWLTRRRWE